MRRCWEPRAHRSQDLGWAVAGPGTEFPPGIQSAGASLVHRRVAEGAGYPEMPKGADKVSPNRSRLAPAEDQGEGSRGRQRATFYRVATSTTHPRYPGSPAPPVTRTQWAALTPPLTSCEGCPTPKRAVGREGHTRSGGFVAPRSTVSAGSTRHRQIPAPPGSNEGCPWGKDRHFQLHSC